MPRNEKIGIIGSGFIGKSWAMLFASAGYQVCIYDSKEEQMTAALSDILRQLEALQESGLLRGTTSAREQHRCIRSVSSLEECVKGAIYVQECVFENLELKKKIFHEMDAAANDHTILASSTSIIVPSKFTADLTHKHNCIVVHPVNPPYYVPMVEVVPAPWTSEGVQTKTRELMKEIGQAPVMFKREQIGFGLNRLQCAVMGEANNLVQSGILSVEDVEIIIKEGLGYRYAWLGVLETNVLNATGVKDFCERYGPSVARVSKDFKPHPSWTVADTQNIISQLEEMSPVHKLEERRQWRDARLAALAKLKRDMKEKEKYKN